MRLSLIAIVAAAMIPSVGAAQPNAPTVAKTDVVYGHVEGSALLANLASRTAQR